MSAVIRPGELDAHIALLEEARALHAQLVQARSLGLEAASFHITGYGEAQPLTTDEVIMVLEARLSSVENTLTNRNITLKRPDMPRPLAKAADPAPPKEDAP